MVCLQNTRKPCHEPPMRHRGPAQRRQVHPLQRPDQGRHRRRELSRRLDRLKTATGSSTSGCGAVASGKARTNRYQSKRPSYDGLRCFWREPVTSADSLQRTLIYNGRVGDKVNIGYREFSGNTARPAFNNNVEYDLTESREIAYRGARLEILDATNRAIKFRVISNFNQANR